MPLHNVPFWKKTPFIRLVIPMIAGIIVQWYLPINIVQLWLLAACGIIIFSGYFFIPFFRRYRLGFLNGFSITLIFFITGALLARKNDIRNNNDWLGHHYEGGMVIKATLDEPLVEKTKSLKANATVNYCIDGNRFISVKGKIIIYFKKDSTLNLQYGSEIIFKKSLQPIKNSGNPGGFDYRRYLLFRSITHQVYLKPADFKTTGNTKRNWVNRVLFESKNNILQILRDNIKGARELGLAEALLIGYKDDLDPSLVQSYTNTGVVHIIAISGLHLGLIYGILVLLLKPLRKRKALRWLRPVLLIGGLWLFGLLAGGQPSVMRSALMFTCIILGENLTRKTSIYNTLAFSAFLLLCYNPYWLWDLGFQLSYTAVLSIIIFMRPVYNWFYFQNKLLDLIWKLNAVTIAAQILTTPLSIYHFHQFPNYFLFTNLIAVPLSSMILVGEIVLCIASIIPSLAFLLGKLLCWLITLMNSYIEGIELLPFSLWSGLQLSTSQTALLFAFVICSSYWLMEKSTSAFKISLLCLLGLLSLRTLSFVQAERQRKLIVYNIARHKAIDFIGSRKHFFLGDKETNADDFISNFHFKPSRTLSRTTHTSYLPGLLMEGNYISYCGKNILLADTRISFIKKEQKPVVNLVIISGNAGSRILPLLSSLEIKQLVFDGSVPPWKLEQWKKNCDSLNIPYHDVSEKGAFVMSLR